MYFYIAFVLTKEANENKLIQTLSFLSFEGSLTHETYGKKYYETNKLCIFTFTLAFLFLTTSQKHLSVQLHAYDIKILLYMVLILASDGFNHHFL